MDHTALLYKGEDSFLPTAVPFLRAGVEAGESVMVAVRRPLLGSIRDELGTDAVEITFRDVADIGANPARIMGLWHDFAARAGERGCRGLTASVWPTRDPDELVECDQHESLVNVALDRFQLQLMCTYDTSGLSVDVVERASLSHRWLTDGNERWASDCFSGHALATELHAAVLRAPPERALIFQFGRPHLSDVRRLVDAQSSAAGLAESRVSELVLSVNELATNSLRYGGGVGRLLVWCEPGTVVCQVEDRGRIPDPLTGRLPPGEAGEGGRGLWLVHQLCDLVQVRSGPDGSMVRVRMRLPR